MEENAKAERRWEDKLIEMERVREEEKRKDREAEQRRAVQRREADKKEREELRRLLAEMKKEWTEEIKSRQKGITKDGEGKEKSKGLKFVLGKSYTENSITDLSKSK